jgi:protein-tyrosine kinase
MSKNFELLQQTIQEQDLFNTSAGIGGAVDKAGDQPKPGKKEEFHPGILKSSSLPMRWSDCIKEKANNWIQQVQSRNNYRLTDQDVITREEEIKLVQRVFPAGGDSTRQVVLFCGIDEVAGCATACVRAGEILAARGEGFVCVVDAALGSPSLHKHFGVANVKGLAEAVLESGPVQDFAYKLPEGNLWVMPSGLTAPRLSVPQLSDRLRSRMIELRASFKYVVIHSSPFHLDPVSIPLSQLTDGVVLVVEANSTRRESARRVKKNLEVARVRLLGVVLNNRTYPIPEALYHRL